MSALNDMFKHAPEDYIDQKDPVNDYANMGSHVLSVMNGIKNPMQRLKKYVKDNKLFKNPKVKFKERSLKGDQTMKVTTLHEYVMYTKRSGDIIVPSFTVYFSRKKKGSLHAEFININVNSRAEHKKLALKFKLAGDMAKFIYHNVIQKVKKIFNNSLSGAYASMGTVLNNASAHYTLTSITRSVTSIGNAIAESFVSGNRHYKDPDVTFNHIVAIAYIVDEEKIKETIEEFNLHIPSVDEVMYGILKSTSKYWRSIEKEKVIYEYLSKISKYQRTAILYTNDLFHIRKHNDKLIRSLIKDVLEFDIMPLTMEEADIVIKESDGWVLNLAVHVNMSIMKGKRIDQLSLENKRTLASFILGVSKGYLKYAGLVQTFLITDIFPNSMAYIKDMLREAIVLSDTDSTCTTYGEWVTWYFGKHEFSDEAVSMTATIMSIVTQSTDHYIKKFAANMNIDNNAANYLEMENEYLWDVFVNTNVSKHYFANILIQESNVLNPEVPKDSLEIKGVNLIVPNAYQEMRVISNKLMTDILGNIGTNKDLSLEDTVDHVKYAENIIYESMLRGSPDVLKLEKIKPANSYKLGPTVSNYLYYTLWQDVFSEKYGESPPPQFMAVKMPTTVGTRKAMNDYLETIEDERIKYKFKEFLKKVGKEHIATIRLPLLIVHESGIPKELLPIMDFKRVIKDNVNHLYIILEGLGYYIKDNSILLEELDDIDVNNRNEL